MWYAVAKQPIAGYQIGSIFQVWKDGIDVVVQKQTIDFDKAGNMRGILIGSPIQISRIYAQRIFTKPTKDFDSVVEESIMQCEAAFC